MGLTFNAERALRWLVDQPRGGAVVLPDGIVPDHRRETTYDELLQAGLVLDTRTPDGRFDFCLTPAGRVEAARMRDRGYRAALVQRRFLEWLENDSRGGPTAFLESTYAQDFTGPITEEELSLGLDELREGQFIAGPEAFGGGIIRAQLTSRGRWLLRSEMSIDQIELQGAATTMNISSNNYGTQNIGAQAVGGQGHAFTGSVTSTVTLPEAVQALDEFIASLNTAEAPKDDLQRLREDAQHIRSRTDRRGIRWVLDEIKALAEASIPVLGREGAQALLELVSGH